MRGAGVSGGPGHRGDRPMRLRVITTMPANDDSDHVPMLINNNSRVLSLIDSNWLNLQLFLSRDGLAGTVAPGARKTAKMSAYLSGLTSMERVGLNSWKFSDSKPEQRIGAALALQQQLVIQGGEQ